jgi:uncharacterized protein Yka (UPF0111/DUF47 family)
VSRPADAGFHEEASASAFRLPAALRRAREARRRLGYVTRLLGEASAQAEQPALEPLDLAADREAAGLDDATLDEVVSGCRLVDGLFHLPQAGRLQRLVVEAMEELIGPLALAGAAEVPGAAVFSDRLHRLLAALPAGEGDLVSDRWLQLLVEPGPDGLQALVAELERAQAALERALVQEALDGATCYGLADDDRPLVRAFMAGLARTAALKLDQPGLQVGATRAGGDLFVQVELVPGEPHQLTVQASGTTAVLAYGDPHLQRVRFFQGLLASHGIAWGETRAREARGADGRETVYRCAGRLVLADAAALGRFLEALGSRLVFLVDWNRARKRLRSFVDGPASLELLRWAAEQAVGHHAFLALGGERLVYEAIEGASPTPVRYGQRLDELLGREAAVDFLRFVFRAASDGLQRGRSERFIRDEIRADLLGRFETLEHGVLAVAAEHALLVGELAGAVRDALAAPGGADEALQRRAADWEGRADALVERVRTLARRSPRAKLYARLLSEADDVADDLEEAAFLLTLPPARSAGPARDALRPLAANLVDGAAAWCECLRASAHVTRGGARQDLQAFLETVDRLVTLEHQTDQAERATSVALFAEGVEPRQLVLFLRVAQVLEQAADALARGALLLRDHFLSEVMGG